MSSRACLALGAILLLWMGAPVAATGEMAGSTSADAQAVDEALASIERLVPDWDLPGAVTEPFEAGDLATAAQAATLARKWVLNAAEADRVIPAADYLGRTRSHFERAASLSDMEDGAGLAESRNIAVHRVASAIEAFERRPRDTITDLGLLGSDSRSKLDEAFAAMTEDRPADAVDKVSDYVTMMEEARSVGTQRLVALVVLGLVVLAVVGLWRWRQRRGDAPPPSFGGPPWATSG